MDDVKKRDNLPQPRLFPFITAWTLGCFLASWLHLLAMSHLITAGIVTGKNFVILVNVGLFASTSSAQFLAIRRFLGVDLRGWAPLAVAGVIIGILALELFPRLITNFLEQEPVARFAFVLMWTMPAILQWSLLRKRFVNHGLWLLAAVIMGPVFAFVYRHGDGIFRSLLADPSWITLRTAAHSADFVFPSIILGLVLYVVIIQNRKPLKGKRAAQ
ncbi:MAG: hypothetical protein OXI30_17865 [Chloroflexota bacterium]|nr:hypothetical protein [Chloroflexota bacterium]